MRLNLTQHPGTPEQGVTEPADKERVRALLTFAALPSREEIEARAEALASLAAEAGATDAMIGGAGFLMGSLERALIRRQIMPLHAFSVRESTEEVLPDGKTVKRAVFRHVGFVPVWANSLEFGWAVGDRY